MIKEININKASPNYIINLFFQSLKIKKKLFPGLQVWYLGN